MTKAAAIKNFFNSFDLPGYPSTAVPETATLPYLTYEPITSSFEGGEVSTTVNLWYHTDSEATPNAKAEEISRAIGRGGVTISCDDGAIWIKRGSPFCTSMSDDADNATKRRLLNITLEFLTDN